VRPGYASALRYQWFPAGGRRPLRHARRRRRRLTRALWRPRARQRSRSARPPPRRRAREQMPQRAQPQARPHGRRACCDCCSVQRSALRACTPAQGAQASGRTSRQPVCTEAQAQLQGLQTLVVCGHWHVWGVTPRRPRAAQLRPPADAGSDACARGGACVGVRPAPAACAPAPDAPPARRPQRARARCAHRRARAAPRGLRRPRGAPRRACPAQRQARDPPTAWQTRRWSSVHARKGGRGEKFCCCVTRHASTSMSMTFRGA